MSDTPTSVCLSKTPVAKATPISNTHCFPDGARCTKIGEPKGFLWLFCSATRDRPRCYVKPGEKNRVDTCTPPLEFLMRSRLQTNGAARLEMLESTLEIFKLPTRLFR